MAPRVVRKAKVTHAFDLKAILYAHKKWLSGDRTAKAADLRGADLSGAKLGRKDLRKANLSRANLEGANLAGANLSGANLSGANLHRARLTGAKMNGAILSRAFAAYVSFKKVDLTDADLTGADLTLAEFDQTIFGEGWETSVRLARLRIVPDGDLIGWKKLRGGAIARLRIPMAAKRSNAFGRRCRAEFAEVLSIVTEDGRLASSGVSKYDGKFVYRVGEVVKADKWNDDWWRDCSSGVHFFMTYQEAEALL